MSDSKDRELFETWYTQGVAEEFKAERIEVRDDGEYKWSTAFEASRHFKAGLESARKETKPPAGKHRKLEQLKDY